MGSPVGSEEMTSLHVEAARNERRLKQTMDQCNYGYYRMYKYVYMYDIVIFVICFIYTVFFK